MANKTDNKTTNQDAQGGRPAAGVPAQTGSASPAQAGQPDALSLLAAVTAERDEIRERATSFREELLLALDKIKALEGKLDAVKVGVPKIKMLLAGGMKATEALKKIAAAVEEATVYLREMRTIHGGQEPEKPATREQVGPYRVLETRHNVNIHGGLTTIPAGTIVTQAAYGLRGIQTLREHGIRMELVEEHKRAA